MEKTMSFCTVNSKICRTIKSHSVGTMTITLIRKLPEVPTEWLLKADKAKDVFWPMETCYLYLNLNFKFGEW